VRGAIEFRPCKNKTVLVVFNLNAGLVDNDELLVFETGAEKGNDGNKYAQSGGRLRSFNPCWPDLK
jgi:hypothetical protein